MKAVSITEANTDLHRLTARLFLVKVLLDKAVDLKDLKFEIVAEDLPATIELKHMWDETSPKTSCHSL